VNDQPPAAITEHQRIAALLRERMARAEEQRDSLRLAIDDMRTARRLTFADDEHDPEGSTVSLDQARDSALLTRTTSQLDELREALQRLDEGRYGNCASCGQPIPDERLRARPEARLCVPCSERAARR
jgi:DnaK suppressor protein